MKAGPEEAKLGYLRVMGFLWSLMVTPRLAASSTSEGKNAMELEARLSSFKSLNELKRAESTEISLFSARFSSCSAGKLP